MKELKVENALISSADIVVHDRVGRPLVSVCFDYGGGGQCMDFEPEYLEDFLKIVGQDRLSTCKGKPVRVHHEGWGGVARAIQHYLNAETLWPFNKDRERLGLEIKCESKNENR